MSRTYRFTPVAHQICQNEQAYPPDVFRAFLPAELETSPLSDFHRCGEPGGWAANYLEECIHHVLSYTILYNNLFCCYLIRETWNEITSKKEEASYVWHCWLVLRSPK